MNYNNYLDVCERMGVSPQHVYEVYVQSQPISGIINLITLGIFIMMTIVTWYLYVKALEIRLKDMDLGMVIVFSLFVLVLFGVSVWIGISLEMIFSPEQAALSLLKGSV